MNINYYGLDSINYDKLEYAVIVAKYKNEWLLVKHKERETWEIPGGKRELHEQIDEAAKRELFEETGATSFIIVPICVYSVEQEAKDESFGMLFYSDVYEIGQLPESEIGEVSLFSSLPSQLTYPKIQPFLFLKVREEIDRIEK
ncbi:NUDIX domain-containing protein [Paenibacillus sp. sgz500992]|uniref:NUDIX hydrolase n=1 Tax=Paenibacillus sp. sgz500992 TaxID=3242476 RepID=UPI0036D20B26